MRAFSLSVFAFLPAIFLTCTTRATEPAGIALQHTATAANSSGNVTYIDHPSLNGVAELKLFVTGQGLGIDHPIAVWYTGTEWTIFTEDIVPIPPGAKFNIIALPPSENVFNVNSTAANTSFNALVLDHPLLNGQPDAKLVVSRDWSIGTTYFPRNYGVRYNGSRWTIVAQTFSDMPVDINFNVAIETGAGQVFSHELTAANIDPQFGISRIDHPQINRDPDAYPVLCHLREGSIVDTAWTASYFGGYWHAARDDGSAPTAGTKLQVLHFSRQYAHFRKPLHGFGEPVSHGADPQVLSVRDWAAGDFDGDGLTDLARILKRELITSTADVDVRLNTGADFAADARWHNSFVSGDEIVLVGDVDGDGLDDLVAFTRGTAADVFVVLSDGSSFGAKTKWHDSFCAGDAVPKLGDVNGDGRADIIAFTRGTTADVFVAKSTGFGFGTPTLWSGDFCPETAIPEVGDVDGDGCTDIIAFYGDTFSGSPRGDVMVARAGSSGFGPGVEWHFSFGLAGAVPLVADVNADGLADILAFSRGSSKRVDVATSTGIQFRPAETWHDDLCDDGQLPLAGSFNSDLNDDIVCVPTGFSTIDLALAGGHAVPVQATEANFGYATMGSGSCPPPLVERPAQVEIPLLVVMVELPGQPTFASVSRGPAFWEQWFFGSDDPSLRNYFLEMSGDRVLYTRAGLVGPLQIDPATANGDARTVVIQRLKDSGFDFRPFDTSRDGTVSNQELVIYQVDNFGNGAGGQTFTVYPPTTLDYDGDKITVSTALAASGYRGTLQLHAHELSHTLGTKDFYGPTCNVGGLSLMHCNASVGGVSVIHLDSYHKMRLGWVRPNAYDLRYPGGACVSSGQLTPTTPASPPIILFDGARGMHEYYMAEFRNSTWNRGRSVVPGLPDAGYDSNVLRDGVSLWWHKTKPDHFPMDFIYIDSRGDDTLQSTVWAGTDDLVVDDPERGPIIHPGPNGVLDSHPPLLILPGPDGTLDSTTDGDDVISGGTVTRGSDNILQSSPAKDDVFNIDDRERHEFTAFTSVTPWDVSSHNDNEQYHGSSGEIRPEWYDQSPLANAIRLETYGSESGISYVQWGDDFAPWLTRASNSNGSLRAGIPFSLTGALGVNSTNAPVVYIDGCGREYDLTTLNGSPTSATVRVPLTVPSGRGRLLCYSDPTRSVASNGLPVTIENEFLDYIALDVGIFLTSEEEEEARDPFGDFDDDGIANIGEFLIGTSISIPGDAVPVSLSGTDVSWSLVSSRQEFGTSIVQMSTDLQTWTEVTPDDESKSGDTTYRSKSLATIGGGQLYFRRVFELP